MRELLLEIGTSVRRNKLRTALTGFSVAWGIFMLTVLLGSGNGLRHGVMANFGDYAVNSINLWGGSTSKPWHGHDKYRRIRLSYDDLGMLAAEFPEVLDITASVWYPEQTATAGRRRHMRIALRGTLPEIARIEGRKLSAGRFLNPQRRGAAAQVGGHRRVAAPRTLRRPGPHGARTAHRPLGLYDRGRGAERRQPLDGLRLHSAHHRAPALRAGRPRIDNIPLHRARPRHRRRDGGFRGAAADAWPRARLRPHGPQRGVALNNMTQHKDMMRLFGGIETFIWIIGLGTLLAAGVVGVSATSCS